MHNAVVSCRVRAGNDQWSLWSNPKNIVSDVLNLHNINRVVNKHAHSHRHSCVSNARTTRTKAHPAHNKCVIVTYADESFFAL